MDVELRLGIDRWPADQSLIRWQCVLQAMLDVPWVAAVLESNMASKRQKAKMDKVMGEFKRGELRSGSKKGPVVRNRKQAIAIALNESGQSKK